MTQNRLTPLEQEIASRLIVGDSPSAAALRRQLAACSVTRRYGNAAGCYTDISVPTDIPPANVGEAPLRLSGVTVLTSTLESGAGFVLLIEGGYLSQLEGFTFGEPWPASFERVSIEAAYDAENDAALRGVES